MVVANSNMDSQFEFQHKSTTSSLLSTISTTIHSINLAVLNTLTSLLDAFIPPSRRASIKSQFTALSQARPFFASFLLCQLLFSGIPLALFVVQGVSVLVFSFTTALVVASLGAFAFTAVCVGVALAVLVPVLAATTCLGVGVWGWAWVGWYVLRWAGLIEGGSLVKAEEGGSKSAVSNENGDGMGMVEKEEG